MNTVVLMPAFREEALVGLTVRTCLDSLQVDRVLVVDDGSPDATADEAEDAGASVLRLPINGGKGTALEAGRTLIADADVVLLLDADLGASAAEASLLLLPILSGEADMTVASFPKPPSPAGFGLVKGLARWGIRRFGGGFEASAPLSGQRALTMEALEKVAPFADGYGVELALTVRALRSGLSVIEVPTEMSHAHTGRDLAGFAHRGRQFIDVARTLIRLAAER